MEGQQFKNFADGQGADGTTDCAVMATIIEGEVAARDATTRVQEPDTEAAPEREQQQQQADEQNEKDAARAAVVEATNSLFGGGVDKLQAALKEGAAAGLEASELIACKVMLATARLEEAMEKASQLAGEAAMDEASKRADLGEKLRAAEKACQLRSYSSYLFGDPNYRARVEEVEQWEEKVGAAQEKRCSLEASLDMAQSAVAASAMALSTPVLVA